eukprot:XP_001707809.1 Hypothetical protein GL50803_11605 [Giardia lamblia ATCC 50803]
MLESHAVYFTIPHSRFRAYFQQYWSSVFKNESAHTPRELPNIRSNKALSNRYLLNGHA